MSAKFRTTLEKIVDERLQHWGKERSRPDSVLGYSPVAPEERIRQDGRTRGADDEKPRKNIWCYCGYFGKSDTGLCPNCSKPALVVKLEPMVCRETINVQPRVPKYNGTSAGTREVERAFLSIGNPRWKEALIAKYVFSMSDREAEKLLGIGRNVYTKDLAGGFGFMVAKLGE